MEIADPDEAGARVQSGDAYNPRGAEGVGRAKPSPNDPLAIAGSAIVNTVKNPLNDLKIVAGAALILTGVGATAGAGLIGGAVASGVGETIVDRQRTGNTPTAPGAVHTSPVVHEHPSAAPPVGHGAVYRFVHWVEGFFTIPKHG